MKKLVLLIFCISTFAGAYAQTSDNSLWWVIEAPEEGNELIIDQLKASGYLYNVLANTLAEYEEENCQDTLSRIGQGYPIPDYMTDGHLENLRMNVHETGIFVSFTLEEYKVEFQIKNPNGWGEEAYVYCILSDNNANKHYYLGDINGALLPMYEDELSARRLLYQYISGTDEKVEKELTHRIEKYVDFKKENH